MNSTYTQKKTERKIFAPKSGTRLWTYKQVETATAASSNNGRWPKTGQRLGCGQTGLMRLQHDLGQQASESFGVEFVSK